MMLMFELILDGSTRASWFAQFSIAATVLIVSLAGLLLSILQRRSRGLAVLAGVLCASSIAIIAFHTTLSPSAYHRRRLEPAIVVGEALYRRYEDYRREHGRYPASIGAVCFSGLDRFDRVEGVREGLPTCDPFGVGCRAIGVRIDGGPVVEVYEELIQCDITNLSREWTCRDDR